MGELEGFDDWLQAQNCLLGAALIDPELVPRVVTELQASDFSGNGLAIYKAMSDLFKRSRTDCQVDAVAVAQYLGDTAQTRQLVAQFMGYSPNFSEIGRYIEIVRQRAKLSRLRSMGSDLSAALTLEDAIDTADAISAQLAERAGIRVAGPDALLESFYTRHKTVGERIEWGLPVVGDYIRARKGNFIVIGAEPSGGKTAFALEQMLTFARKRRVLYVSLETDEDELFDRLSSRLAGIPMDAVMDGKLSPQQWQKMDTVRDEIRQSNFKIVSGAGLGISGIKATALSHRADIVIIDYLQIVQMPGRMSRYEKITEISMALHIMAQTTGLIVIALSQVTNRDPSSRNAPLSIHSARESGQIEADADAILMLDKFVEKGLRESGCRANRILRIVKNKKGRCCNIPLVFDGNTQSFSRAFVPNPNWEKLQSQKKKKRTQQDELGQSLQNAEEFEQLPMDTPLPF